MIRAALESDAESICALHVAAIREVCGLVYDARAIEAWAGAKRPERYRAAIAESIMLVAEGEGVIAGFGELHLATAELKAVYVRPDSLRRGIGRRILQALEDSQRVRPSKPARKWAYVVTMPSRWEDAGSISTRCSTVATSPARSIASWLGLLRVGGAKTVGAAVICPNYRSAGGEGQTAKAT
jgi:GNAT superfamily N-acetyltransferase